MRETVILPDSSHRPTVPEEEAALHRKPAPLSLHPSMAPIRSALAELDAVDLTDLEVVLTEGHVTLSGSVATRADRDRIVAAVEAVPDHLGVIDTLRIRLD
ncbi:MAG: BON domain-containing protein [Myxococcales bacterium]|nr:BON domain-containing protein [Myxococcales bacterium]